MSISKPPTAKKIATYQPTFNATRLGLTEDVEELESPVDNAVIVAPAVAKVAVGPVVEEKDALIISIVGFGGPIAKQEATGHLSQVCIELVH